MALAWVWAVSACVTTGSPADDDTGSSGVPVGGVCVQDSDCAYGLCQGGACAAPNGASSGVAMASSRGTNASSATGSGGAGSAGTGSGGTASVATSSGGALSSGAGVSSGVSAGTSDPGPPLGTPETDPAVGPLEFGAVRLGIPVEKVVLVTNVGAGTLTLVQAGVQTLDGSATSGFSVEPSTALPATLAPQAQLSLRVRFTPSSAAQVSARLNLAFTQSTQEVVTLDILALFKGSPTLTLHRAAADSGSSLTGLQMGPIPVGQTVTGHVLIKNTGADGSALSVESVAVEPPGSTAFTLQVLPLPRSISLFPGLCASVATCSPLAAACVDGLCVGEESQGSPALDVVDVAVTYSALTAGVTSASLVVRAVGAGGSLQQSVPLSGTGQLGALVATPSPVAFGDVFVARSSTQDITLRNASNVTLTLSAIEWATGSSAVFSLPAPQPSLPALLGPNATVAIPVAFAPDATASFTGQLILRSTTADALTVDVAGRGLQAPSIRAQALLDFGDQQAGTARVLPLALFNDGPGELRLGAMTVQPASVGSFTFQPTVITAPVAAGSSVSLQVTFAPGAASTTPTQAELVLQSNDPARAETRVALRGRSIGPVANPSRVLVDLGTVRVGALAMPLDMVLTNTGIGPLQVTGMGAVVDGVGAPLPNFTVTPGRALPATVNDGGTDALAFTFGFAPSVGGQQTGTFSLGTTDPARSVINITVTARGLACSSNHIPNPTETNGVCDGVCEATYGDCNLNKATDGCEVALLENVLHCNGCGQACSTSNLSGVSCTAGVCGGMCMMGFGDCNNDKRTDGCETNVTSSAAHCGGCGTPCSGNNVPTPTCFAGSCTGQCATGTGDCNNDRRTDGCEINTQSNPAHCGGCARTCSTNHIATPTCSTGTCNGTCDPGFFDCDNNKLTNGCETVTATSTDHCGGCGLECSQNNLAVSCSSGVCNGMCNPGYLDCNNDRRSDGCEVNGDTDNAHCGNCTNVCNANEECQGGSCVPQCTVIINEVAAEGLGGAASDEMIELFNPCPVGINLRNWSIRYRSAGNGAGSDPYVFPDVDRVLAAGAYYVLGKGSFAGASNAPLSAGSGMSGTGGGIGLHNTASTRVDSVTWSTLTVTNHPYTEGAAPAARGSSRAIFRRSPNGRDTNSTAADWAVSTAANQITPGAQNP